MKYMSTTIGDILIYSIYLTLFKYSRCYNTSHALNSYKTNYLSIYFITWILHNSDNYKERVYHCVPKLYDCVAINIFFNPVIYLWNHTLYFIKIYSTPQKFSHSIRRLISHERKLSDLLLLMFVIFCNKYVNIRSIMWKLIL